MPDILIEIKKPGMDVPLCGLLAQPRDVKRKYDVTLDTGGAVKYFVALITAVSHKEFLTDPKALFARPRPVGVFINVKSAFSPKYPWARHSPREPIGPRPFSVLAGLRPWAFQLAA